MDANTESEQKNQQPVQQSQQQPPQQAAEPDAEQKKQELEQLHLKLRQYFDLFQAEKHPKALKPADISHLVHSNIVFKDPFQRINGPQALCQLLNHFHSTVKDARFLIEAVFEHPRKDPLHNRHYLVKWRFSGHQSTLGRWEFPGVSEIEQDENGCITHHTDFWDAGEHFYGKLPFFGKVIQWIQTKVANAGKG